MSSSSSESESESESEEQANEESVLTERSELNTVNSMNNKVLSHLVNLCEKELLLEKLRQAVCSFQDFQSFSIF